MSAPADLPRRPSEPELAAEAADEERAERWLLVRQVAIVLALTALVLSRVLLG